MPLQEVEYLTLREAADEMGLKERQVRNLCEEYEWFGGKMGVNWVITRRELDKMKETPRRGPGRPRKPIGESGE